jgi:predicted DNA-binding protein with PD1-like motif
MHAKLIHQSPDGQRTFVVVLETGEEVTAQLKTFANCENLKAAQLTASAHLAMLCWVILTGSKRNIGGIP